MASIVLQMVAWSVVMAALIFWPAGTFAYPGGWVFVGLFFVGGLAIMLWLAKYSPKLLRERLSSPVQRDQKPWDRVFLLLFMGAFFVWIPVTAWDAARNAFVAVPLWLQIAGGVAVALYMIGAWATFRENAFAAPVVKIQEGQHVIDSGPYAIVRHPMYASALLLFIGLPLLLGSWWGLAFNAILIPGLGWRAVNEEEMLRKELAGYDAYATRVRYRFVPAVW
jgi:protein-S-isoprenylcysteine O-methyltransferase Ste14